jgi:long-chain fatty acid transport protein
MRIATALLLFAATAHASVPDLIGIGPRQAAMAGAGVADCDDYEATYVNPAGLVAAKKRRLTAGYLGARYSLQLDGNPRNITNTDGILIGAALPLPFGGVLKDRLAIGLAFYFPVGLINRAAEDFPNIPRLALLDDRTQTVSVLVAASAQLHSRVRLGVGVLALAALVGQIVIKPDATGAATTVSEEQLITNFAPVIGVQVKTTSWLDLGLVLRGESRSDYNIAIKPQLGDSVPIALPTLQIKGTSQYDPLQIAVEGAFQATSALRVTVGVTWKHWSSFGQPVENATAGATPLMPPNFHDTAVPRLALEARGQRGRFGGVVRAGYAFEWSPAPQGDMVTLLDADRHVVGAGLGGSFNNRHVGLRLDVFGQMQVLNGNPRASGYFGVFGAAMGVDL